MHVTLLRSGNDLTAEPTTSAVRDALVPALTFVEIEFKRGREALLARRAGRSTVDHRPVECFTADHKGRVTFPFGFLDRAIRALAARKMTAGVENLTPPVDPTVYEPQWDRVFHKGVALRERQDEFLVQIAGNDNGRFDCPTGWGKSFAIGLACRMWPKARIAVVSDSVTVVRDRLYPELCQMLPDVGIVGGQRKVRGRRVMCYTADSLHWLVKDSEEFGHYEALFVDESHQAAADDYSYKLSRVPGQPRMYGLSASHGMRADGKDYRCEGLFGPIRLKITYEEAKEAQLVVPMEVRVRRVVMDVNPCSGFDDEEKMRHGVWRNDYMTDLVLRDAVRHAARGEQVMISCQVLEHVLRFKQRFERLKQQGKLAAELDLVCLYREHDSPADRAEVIKAMKRKGVGHVLEALPMMTSQRRQVLTRRIEKGKIVLFAGTTILNVGFDPKDMRVVCRADHTSSKIADTQVPGRNSRHSTDGTKKVGIVYDYWPKFDRGLEQKYKSRARSYRALGWEVHVLGGGQDTALKQKTLWE